MAEDSQRRLPVIGGVPATARSAIVAVAPWFTAALLCAACVGVWQRQMRHERQLLAAHTEDIALETSRRLEMAIELRLAMAEVIAQRWAEHEQRDYSRQRFESFARLLVLRVPGYDAVGLSPDGTASGWVYPADHGPLTAPLHGGDPELLRTARRSGVAVITAPSEVDAAEIGFHAILPLQHGTESLGFLWIEFHAQTLVDGCFGEALREEFQFIIEDGVIPVFRYRPEPDEPEPSEMAGSATRSFPVANREWTLTMAPRPDTVAAFTDTSNLAILLLGLTLSVGVAALMYLLSSRVVAHLRDRDAALREVEERKRAEVVARTMEERYRGVFESAAEGLLVLEQSGMIVEANRAACEMHGYAPDELIGHQARELFAEEHQHRFDEFVKRLEEEGSVTFEAVDVRRDGSRIDVELRGTRLVHRGQPAMLAILTDVTDRNRAIRQRLQLSRKVLMAQEDERARVSRDLHDGLGQQLTALRFELDWMSRQAGSGDSERDFGEANRLVESAAEELRGICEGLRPPLLDELGLETSVRELVEEVQARHSLKVELYLRVDEEERAIPSEIALITYRVLQEALHNVQRHADAEHVSVSVLNAPDGLLLSVHDDGKGLDADRLHEAAGLGIAGMRERASLVGGTLDILSELGVGTRVILSIPIVQGRSEERT